MQKRVALLVSAANTLASPQVALAHSQSLAALPDSPAFARWESMGGAGPEPIQSIDGKSIPGAPNGMLAEADTRGQPVSSSTNASAMKNGTTRSGANATNARQTAQNLPQEIRAKLKNDGFTNVKVIPGSFIVSAKDKRGEPVTMIIGPDSMMMVTQVTNGDGSSMNSKTNAFWKTGFCRVGRGRSSAQSSREAALAGCMAVDDGRQGQRYVGSDRPLPVSPQKSVHGRAALE